VPLTRKLQQLVEYLGVVDDPQERLTLLVDQAKRLPELPAPRRTAETRVPGCVSIVWLGGEVRDGRCYFQSAAESPIVRALVAFQCEFFSGFAPADILKSDVDPLDAIGVARNLSPTRRNGLQAARRAIRDFASAHLQPMPHDSAGM
jgi:cysteine desulfuration protein SufE